MLSDVVIPLRTQPVAETLEAASGLLRLASTFAAHVSLRPLVATARPVRHRWSGAFTNLLAIGAEIERASLEAANCLLTLAVDQQGMQVTGRPLPIGIDEPAIPLTSAARCHDLTMISFTDSESGAAMAEAAVFGTGRPAMLVPARIPDAARPFAKIALAWDGGGTASRALYDAMPLLLKADEVVVVYAPEDKQIDRDEIRALSDYLARHDVPRPRVVEADLEVLDIGLALQHCASTQGAGLLVMGGFGHSRMRQFILGGATRHVLTNLRLPVLMSHS